MISGGKRAALTATSAVARSHHRNLAEAAGLEPAHAMRGDLVPTHRDCHTIRRRLLKDCPPATAGGSDIWRKGQDSNLQATSAVVFGTTALPVRLPFQEKQRSLVFVLWTLKLRNPYVQIRARESKSEDQSTKFFFLVHVVGLAPTKDNQVRLISKEGAFAAQPHMRNGIQISDLTRKISSLRSICAKKWMKAERTMPR